MTPSQTKVLIIRLSSFGDVAQCLEVADQIKNQYAQSEIHWIVRSDFSDLVESHPCVDRVWKVERQKGLAGLLDVILQLRKIPFTHIYDAHSNLRSHLICVGVKKIFGPNPQLIRRPKNRWKRYLLFHWHKNLFPHPYRGMVSYLKPIKPWNVSFDPLIKKRFLQVPEPPPRPPAISQSLLPIVLCPSAAWPLKRWPLESWHQLVRELPEFQFVILGGPKDQFCQSFVDLFGQRCQNRAGKLSWMESVSVIQQAALVVSADTGLMHLADYLGVPTVALIGPTAFGYPSRTSSLVCEVQLECKPCTKDGRGKCHNATFKKCLVELKPELIAHKIRESFSL